jgi:tyrosyl-tRNA synthetase
VWITFAGFDKFAFWRFFGYYRRMKANTNPKKIAEVLGRGTAEVIDKEHLRKRLEAGEVLRVKLGIDPTSPNIHIGRSIPLLKLRDFQEMGHKIVLIIGDFTGVIGDTSDKDSERPMLAKKQITENMKSYIQQAAKIIDIKKCETRYNSEWLGKLNYHEIGRQADVFSLAEFLARENIKKRLDGGKRISLRELLYPLMQGYDSVAIKADVEIGGTDQRFNLLAGRELQKSYGQAAQDILTNPLIAGLDGRKMSSSWGNTINLFDLPNNMYGKVMSLKDELIGDYFELCTRVPMEEVKKIKQELVQGQENPKNFKERLAKEVVTIYYNSREAQKAQEEFNRVFSQQQMPSEIPEFLARKNEYPILDLLVDAGLADSKSEAKRLVEGGAVDINGAVENNWKAIIKITDNMIIKAGKRKFVKVKV